MPLFLLSFLGIGKSLLGGLIQGLSRRSMTEIGCIALGMVCLVLVIGNRAERRHSAKLQRQIVSLSAQLQKITTAKNQQQIVTAEKIKLVVQRIHDADGRAKVIEQAALPGQCKTPPEILQADI